MEELKKNLTRIDKKNELSSTSLDQIISHSTFPKSKENSSNGYNSEQYLNAIAYATALQMRDNLERQVSEDEKFPLAPGQVTPEGVRAMAKSMGIPKEHIEKALRLYVPSQKDKQNAGTVFGARASDYYSIREYAAALNKYFSEEFAPIRVKTKKIGLDSQFIHLVAYTRKRKVLAHLFNKFLKTKFSEERDTKLANLGTLQIYTTGKMGITIKDPRFKELCEDSIKRLCREKGIEIADTTRSYLLVD